MPRCVLAVARGLPILVVLCCTLAGAAGAAARDDDCESLLQRLCCRGENVILISGCVPKQRVPLMLGGGDHEVFVNGERVDEVTSDLRLRADRDHTVFIRRPGYKPELVVLRSEGESGEETLNPSRIELQLVKRVEVESLAVSIGEVTEPPKPEPPAKQRKPEPGSS
jgi:hypothetical protein